MVTSLAARSTAYWLKRLQDLRERLGNARDDFERAEYSRDIAEAIEKLGSDPAQGPNGGDGGTPVADVRAD
jgi:hypothetical protein